MARALGALAVASLVLCNTCLASNLDAATPAEGAAPGAVSETWTIVADDAPMVEDRTEPLGLAAADEEFLLEEQEAEALGDGVAGAGVKEEAPDEQPPEPSTLWDGLVRLAGIVGWVVVLGVMWLGSLFYNQENVLYHPEQPKGYRSPSDIPEEAGLSSPAARDPPLPFKTVFLATEDGARLHAWMVHAADPDLRKRVPTLVFLHGNAGSEFPLHPAGALSVGSPRLPLIARRPLPTRTAPPARARGRRRRAPP